MTSATKVTPILLLIWSYFKPEFSDKPDANSEAHLLRANDWMDIHAFSNVVKFQRICLTRVDETRSRYESLRAI